VHTLDQRDPLAKPLLGSLATHILIAGLFFAAGLLHVKNNWGDTHASTGSVGVNMVKTIPIPRNEGPTNPLANDTHNIVPQETMPVKVRPATPIPQPKAIPIPDKTEKQKKFSPKPLPPLAEYKPQSYQANQVYSRTPQAMNSPMFGVQGAGGIDIGPASVLGNRFGAYVNLMRNQIAQHWNTADVRARPSDKCAVAFTILRNGTLTDVRISHPSGSLLLDNSAKRAILDSNPLPALPAAYNGNDVTVELWFQLTQ
jgi:protein TonB